MRFIELHESSAYLLLETPQRLAWIIANRGPNLLAKYEAEKQHGVIAMETSRHVDLIDGETPTEKLVKFIMSFDPTPAKNYSNWLCSRYMAKPEKGGCRLEDFNASLTADLAMFERVSRSRRIENGNLDSYKSLQALEDVIEPFREGDREVSNRADRAAGRSTAAPVMFPASDPMRTPEHCDILLDTPEMLIIQLKTETAARHFGENTSWCTTNGMFDSYNEHSPLYILCDRKKNTRTQWHFNGSNSQFMDERDRSIDLNKYLREHPVAFKVFRQQMLALMGVTTYGGQTLDPDLFSPEDFADAPVKTIVRMIKKPSEIDKLPQVLTEEGFYAIVLRRPNKKHDHWSTRENGATFEDGPFRQILNKFFKALKAPFFIKYLMDDYFWIWSYLPDKWKTDKVKDQLADKVAANSPNSPSAVCSQFQSFYFGDDRDAWTPNIKKVFYDCAADAGWAPDNFPEEEFTDGRMVKSLANNPEEIPNFIPRLNKTLVALIVRFTSDSDIRDVFEALPAEYRNKETAKALHTNANQYKAKRDQGQRDNFLHALTHFDHEHWGSKAQRIAELSKAPFSQLPAQFQNKEFAARLVAEQPAALHRIPAAFMDQAVVNSAMTYGKWKWVLEECDPRIVTPEMVLEGVKASLDDRSADVSHDRSDALYIPEVYKTYRPMLDYLLENAALPFDDEHWPDDAWTPEFVLKRFRREVKGERARAYSSSAYGYGRGRHNSDWHIKERQKEWDARFERVWATLPAAGHTPEIVEALVKAFPTCPTQIDKSLLTAPLLSQWMEDTSKSSALSAAEAKTTFEAFPKEAWTNPVLAQAVKRSYISAIPDEFKDKIDPNTVIEMIMSTSHYKDVDWSTVTPDMLTTAIGKSSYNSVIDRVPKDSPLLDEEKVVFAALRHAVKDEQYGSSYWPKQLAKIWPPEKRGHWAQRDWDLAGGSVIPWNEVPEKFRHDDLSVKTILRDPANLQHLPNPIKWLNENSQQITTAKGFKIDCWVAQGIYYDGEKWVDDKTSKHVKAANGAYSVVHTDTGATIAYIYDDKGELVNGLASKLKSGESYSNQTYNFTSDWSLSGYASHGEEKFKGLSRVRDVIEIMLENTPEIEHAFTSNYGASLDNIQIFKDGEGKLTKLEKLPRKRVSNEEGTTLTYVIPQRRGWGETPFILYDGEGPDAPMAARINIDTRHGGGNKFENSKVYGTGKDHIRWSKDLMRFLHGDGDIASGSGPKFKASDLYRSCGIRGTGSFEWFSLFDEKIMEHGGMSIWRLGRVISIADDEHGLVATGKKAKDGSFALTEKFAEDLDDAKLAKIFALMKGKL